MERPEPLFHYTLTKYPDVYKKTYWGRSKFLFSDKNNVVIKNRNSFINDYEIDINYKKKKPTFLSNYTFELKNKYLTLGDHPEVYKNKNGDWVLIVSPYSNCIDDTEFILKTGFKRIYTLYDESSVSYIKYISKHIKKIVH